LRASRIRTESSNVYLSVPIMLLLTASFVLGLSTPALSSAVSSLTKSPSVTTPWGSAPSSCVHPVGSGVASVEHELGGGGGIVVTYTNGITTTFQSCSGGGTDSTLTNGWVETGYADVSPTTSISAHWKVPGAPSSNDNQIIYMFPATQNCFSNCGNYVFIIQPVLQWGYNGDFGGSYYVLASWWVDSNGNYFYSTPINVSPGDKLIGSEKSNKCNSSYTCNWAITGKDGTTGTKTTLKRTSLAEQTTIFMTLEVYYVVSCKDYPSGGSTTFHGILVNGGKLSASAWTPDVMQNDGCGERVAINSGTSITLYY
jgi:hypothetical protein